MSTQRIVFGVLTATLYFSAAAFADESTDETSDYGELVAVFPNQPIAIYAGNSMTLRMVDQYESLTSCIVTLPSGELFDTLNDEAGDISAFDQCGVLVHGVSDNHTGTWRLDAVIGENVNYYGHFSVQVLTLNSTPTESVVLRVERGTSVPVSVGPSSATSCRFKNPLGEDLPLLVGNCQADIESVNEAHEGVWTVTYSVTGGVTLFEEKFEIVIYDEIPFNATVTSSNDGRIHLLCRVRAVSASVCQFITPYDRILDMVDGLGNDRYIQSGSGLKSSGTNVSQDHECGLTILKPEASDYGTWKCIVGTDSGLTGSILKVSTRSYNAYEYIDLRPAKYKVYVTKGNSFELKCSVDVPLRYCLMQSPSGRIYTVSKNGDSSTALEYTGMGLSLGECGAVIPASEYAHEGNWHCTVGLHDERQFRRLISVTVSDTMLVPSSRIARPKHGETQLSCYVPREYGYSIDYCQWLRPSGAIISSWQTDNYQMWKTSSSCYLNIKTVREPYDDGKWTCMASLVGSSENVLASIEVPAPVKMDLLEEGSTRQRSSNTFYFFMLLAFSISATCLAGFLIAIFRAKRLAKRQISNSPPKYSENNVGTPPII